MNPFISGIALHIGLLGLFTSPCISAATFELPPADQQLVGEPRHITTQYEDTLVQIAWRYNLGYDEIRIANPRVDPWLPGQDTPLILPTHFILPDAPRKGIVINIAEMRLYYYPIPRSGELAEVVTYPISIGRGDWQTPLTTTKIISKVENPAWYPPESVRKEHAERGDLLAKIVPPGPDNPLGLFAMKLGLPSYLIHGTNRPSGIGMQVTHGCIRMRPADIDTLFHNVEVGTPVTIVNQMFKAGWFAGVLYLEAHPPLKEGEMALEKSRDLTPLTRTLLKATKDREDYTIDWKQVMRIATHPRGVPIPIRLKSNKQESSTNHLAMGSHDPGSENYLLEEWLED
ncbi:MAG: L,D-transpeptidase family protein [Gammaproteobacteria bacterium]|nr:L,D-transpeptidase family protein [Gammaproteobacteria bacterium]